MPWDRTLSAIITVDPSHQLFIINFPSRAYGVEKKKGGGATNNKGEGTTGKITQQGPLYKWTQTCKSNERFREAVSLKAALTGIKPLVPSGSCFTIVFFKFACKLWKAASLFATKRPHFQAHTSAAAREALFCCSHPACIYYQGTFYTHITPGITLHFFFHVY